MTVSNTYEGYLHLKQVVAETIAHFKAKALKK